MKNYAVRNRPCGVLFAWLLVFGSQAANAANFEIAPVLLELSSTHTTDAIRIINRDERPISIQVRSYRWRQEEGQDQLEPATDLLLSPPLFTLAPGAAQVVRILAKTTTSDHEAAYRLLLDQIPVVGDPVGINFKFRVSLPVFMAPKKKAEAVLSWRVTGGTVPHVQVTNGGNRHAKLSALSLTLADGQRITPETGAHAYVLAHSTRNFAFATATALNTNSPVLVSAVSDAGAQTVSLSSIDP